MARSWYGPNDLLKPLADKLTDMGVVIKSKAFVTELTYENERVTSVKTSEGSVDCDAVVLALGRGRHEARPSFVHRSSTAISASLNAIDVVAVRLWRIVQASPVNSIDVCRRAAVLAPWSAKTASMTWRP